MKKRPVRKEGTQESGVQRLRGREGWKNSKLKVGGGRVGGTWEVEGNACGLRGEGLEGERKWLHRLMV